MNLAVSRHQLASPLAAPCGDPRTWRGRRT